jgi:hypothetical protein
MGWDSEVSDWLRDGQSRYRKKKNPDEGEVFSPVQTDPGAHPASCTMDIMSLSLA